MTKRFEFFPHTADVKFRAYGKDLAELFSNAVSALAAVLGGEERWRGRATIEKHLVLSAPDRETLLVDFLSEILTWSDAEDALPHTVIVEEISDTSLSVRVSGARGVPFTNDVKAVTYSDLRVEQVGDRWEADVVLDV